MLRQAVAVPVALEQPQVTYEPIAIPRLTPCWGPPIWAADDPMTPSPRRVRSWPDTKAARSQMETSRFRVGGSERESNPLSKAGKPQIYYRHVR